MASKKSGIPVKSSIGAKTGGVSQSNIPRLSNIPVIKAKSDATKPAKPVTSSISPNESDLHECVKRLENDVRDKDSAINDLNEKLMKSMNESQILREENEAARANLNLSNEGEISVRIKDLEKLLNEKEIFIEDMLNKKQELERKFEAELEMLKNQHEVELLSLEQQLKDCHQEKIDELETSLNKEKQITGRLREEVKAIHDQGVSKEINMLHEEMMSTKLRYETEISTMKQDMERIVYEKEDFVKKTENCQREIQTIKEKHKDEIETLKYLVQEKDIVINDLKSNQNNEDNKSQDTKLYTDEQVTSKLQELRQELATENEHNLQLSNELWRKKFDEQQNTDAEIRSKEIVEGKNNENTDKLLDEISELKEQLQEAKEQEEEVNEMLESQEKEMEELRESEKKFEERYNTLYKEMEGKWQTEFGESEVIEKIKSHYEMEIERLHGEMEDIQNENSNLKTEVDLMSNDFDGGHARVNAPVRHSSVTARLDMKAEIEDYKVQLATIERDLQHALNQNERLKLENNLKRGELAGSKLEEVDTFSKKVEELQGEREKLIAERDEFRAKFEESKKERKKLEKDCKNRDEEKTKIKEELQVKIEEIALLKEKHQTGVKHSESKALNMEENIRKLTTKCDMGENELLSLREKLKLSENRERDLREIVQKLNDKEISLSQKCQEDQMNIAKLKEELEKSNMERDIAEDGLSKLKDSEEGRMTETRKKVRELESMLAQGKVASEALKVKYDKLLKENETKTAKIVELEEELKNSKGKYEMVEANDTGNNDEVKQNLEKKNEEYDSLVRQYEESVHENETKNVKISEIESLLHQKKTGYDKLEASYNELNEETKNKESTITSLEAEINKQKSLVSEMESLNNNLKDENVTLKSKVDKMKGLLKQSTDECAKLRINNEDLSTENEKKQAGEIDIETALNKAKTEYEGLNESYQNLLEESRIKVSKIEKLEKDSTQLRKQITAFEKKVTTQERDKKSLEEKISSLEKIIEEQTKEISSLKEKCESYDWKNTELETKLKAVKNTEDCLNKITEKNQELLNIVEETTREKNDLLASQAKLMKENKELRDERDTLRNEKQGYDNDREQDNSEHERKLETAQKKLKEKDRVLNETKKHCRQLKESEKELQRKITEKEETCWELERKVEELHRKLKDLSSENENLRKTGQQNNNEEILNDINNVENTKLKQQLEEARNVYTEKEKAWKDEMEKQKSQFACELKNVQDKMEQSAQNQISRLKEENNEHEEMRKKKNLLSEENHRLKIKLDDLGIEISKEKEEKYKAEKLKDHFRFEVQTLQEKLEVQQEKINVLQKEQLRGEKRIDEERTKLLATLSKYESKNTELISDIDKASSVLKTTKVKYGKLKEKFSILAKKYTKLSEEKLNKSDVQVGPDTSIDLSLAVEDLQRSKENAEEENLKLRAELDKLREEIGRNEYQVKAVRRANVVLMKQSRCLYQESEQNKRLDEERTVELQKYREVKESLQREKETWQKEREVLEDEIKKLKEETARLKQESDEYFLAKNKTEMELGEKSSECVSNYRQLEKLKDENDYLYKQGKKLQAELDLARMTSMTHKPEDNKNFASFENQLTKNKHQVESERDFRRERMSQEVSGFTDSIDLGLDEARPFPIFNNEKIIGDKIIESASNNIMKSATLPGKKDTNLQILRNINNNEFPTEKYLGKTYWDTLDFLKKK